MGDLRGDWFHRRDPWFWATWEGSRLASLLAARELTFWERLGRVEQLARCAEEIVAAGAGHPPGSGRHWRTAGSTDVEGRPFESTPTAAPARRRPS